MDSFLTALIVWLIITMSFAALWIIARGKLKGALKQIEKKQRIADLENALRDAHETLARRKQMLADMQTEADKLPAEI